MESSIKYLWILTLAIFTNAQLRQNPCEVIPTGNGFVNDYSSCPAYYSCVSNVPFEKTCPEPFYFHETGIGEGLCEWPDQAECRRCPVTGVVNIRRPDSCFNYTQCINGNAIDRSCAPGTAFDRQLGMCVVVEQADCSHINPCSLISQATGNAPSPLFCNDFYICFNDELVSGPHRCQSGLLFDSIDLQCKLQQTAVCFSGSRIV
ncbi:hypothetical protein PVAND_010003 [Polypedilum vanderplanki]|uniref:Chitin-binding type-2 domain-containing protein n=1 Tax=Polypedilum vanderplanki TaxID=319348 RepID=A0A9J6CFB4_POLVA|nr:hypothetical protein PVAND_010003 [Polypedilum vanderplanki]